MSELWVKRLCLACGGIGEWGPQYGERPVDCPECEGAGQTEERLDPERFLWSGLVFDDTSLGFIPEGGDLTEAERFKQAYVVIPCRHGWENQHCTLDAEGSHPGPLLPTDTCYCGEAVRHPLVALIGGTS